MASGFEDRHRLFADAQRILKFNLEKLCTTDLDPTWTPETIQPALFITSVCAARSLNSHGLSPDAVAGHSLGELAACVAAGALSFEDGLQLVDVRGRAMAESARRHPGGMAAVLGLDPAKIEQICSSEEGVWVANLNSPKQTVISGRDKALAVAAGKCLEAGAKRVVRLQVPFPSHCALMQEARVEFEAALARVDWNQPSCPVFCGADGRAHTDPSEISRLLGQALTMPVRFVETVISVLNAGVTMFVETGPGKVLRGLIRQIDTQAGVAGASDDQQAAALAQKLGPEMTNSTESSRAGMQDSEVS